MEYKIDGEAQYKVMAFTFFRLVYLPDQKNEAGYSHHLQVDLKIPKITDSTSEMLHSLLGRKLRIGSRMATGGFIRPATPAFRHV